MTPTIIHAAGLRAWRRSGGRVALRSSLAMAACNVIRATDAGADIGPAPRRPARSIRAADPPAGQFRSFGMKAQPNSHNLLCHPRRCDIDVLSPLASKAAKVSALILDLDVNLRSNGGL